MASGQVGQGLQGCQPDSSALKQNFPPFPKPVIYIQYQAHSEGRARRARTEQGLETSSLPSQRGQSSSPNDPQTLTLVTGADFWGEGAQPFPESSRDCPLTRLAGAF